MYDYSKDSTHLSHYVYPINKELLHKGSLNFLMSGQQNNLQGVEPKQSIKEYDSKSDTRRSTLDVCTLTQQESHCVSFQVLEIDRKSLAFQ